MTQTSKYLRLNTPIIASYPEQGNIFSILPMVCEDVRAWVASNFINIYCYYDRFTAFENHWTILNDCPFFEIETTSCIANNPLDFREFIISSINGGYYVVLKVNNYYISKSQMYLKGQMNHMTMVSGYDFKKRYHYNIRQY